MAHANPEFALGLMRPERGPVRYQTRPPASLAQLRARMIDLAATPSDERTPEQQRQLDLWFTTCRQQKRQVARERQLQAAFAEPVGGMHTKARPGEIFVPPTRRGEGRTQRWAQS